MKSLHICRRLLASRGTSPVLHITGRSVSFWGSNKLTDWNQAVSEAEKIVGYPTSFLSLRCLLSDELSNVALQMRRLVGTNHPLLKTARNFFYDGKHSMQTRGLLVLLISKAAGASASSKDEAMISGIYPRQRSLAEIIEMINTANLIHKGVVNLEELLPADGPEQDMKFGNKMSVLSGDFLLANASIGLAELKNTLVVEMISRVIGDLMEAEFTSLKDSNGAAVLPESGVTYDDWREQTYLSSASLIAHSCKSALMLADHPPELQALAFEFGEQMAYAHQLHEDLSPFKPKSSSSLCATSIMAPAILYCQYNLDTAREQNLLANPDVHSNLWKKLVKGHPIILEETKQKCKQHGEKALAAIRQFDPSDARKALENMVIASIAV